MGNRDDPEPDITGHQCRCQDHHDLAMFRSMAYHIARHSLREHPSMSDFIIDADPFIPSGVPATVEEVAAFVVDGVLPADKVADLHPDQQPDNIGDAVAAVVADRVEAGADLADYTQVLIDVEVSVKDVEQVVMLRADTVAEVV